MPSKFKFAGALCESPRLFCGDSHSNAAFHFPLIIRVYPAALTVRVHEVPRPVRVHSQGGWVRNGIKVDWI